MRKARSVVKGLAAGTAGGLAGSWFMNQLQDVWGRAKQKQEQRKHPWKAQQHSSEHSADATMKVAESISESFLGRRLSYEKKKKAGSYVYYEFGALIGAAYGGTSELMPWLRKGFGLTYSTAVFVGADEIAVSAFGLGANPVNAPLSSHAYALASHWVNELSKARGA